MMHLKYLKSVATYILNYTSRFPASIDVRGNPATYQRGVARPGDTAGGGLCQVVEGGEEGAWSGE